MYAPIFSNVSSIIENKQICLYNGVYLDISSVGGRFDYADIAYIIL